MDSRYSDCPTCGSTKKRSAAECRACSVVSRYGTPEQRFWSKVGRTESCWQWQGHISTNGYGRVFWEGHQRQAHRVAYEITEGAIPHGLTIDHLCRNTACVRPDHLEAVTGRENTLRGTGPSARLARSETCSKGHPYDASYIVRGQVVRQCRVCRREYERTYKPAWRRRRAADKCREALEGG